VSESTTPDLLNVIGRGLEALSHRDYDGALAPFSPHAVFGMSPAGAEVLEGRDSIRSFFEDWVGPYEHFGQQLEEVHDLGNGVTLGVVAQRGRLPGSSSFLFVVGGHVGVWRDGLLERNTVYADIDEARAAAECLAEERG
jgi:ketosteroid isomerase-like protein